MSRSANCIKMLTILKGTNLNRVVSREELARRLNCNIRNISEYKKELQDAGYYIGSVSGKDGGYYLDENSIFPTLALTSEQIKTLRESYDYMLSQNFAQKNLYTEAMDKVLASIAYDGKEKESIYIHNNNISITKEIEQKIQMCKQAIKEQKTMIIEYKGTKQNDYNEVKVHPYEILYSNDSYYLLAYSMSKKAFRQYKFSDERMRKLKMTSISFSRDYDFNVNDYVGNRSILHDQTYELELHIKGSMITWVKENLIGMDIQYEMIDDNTMKYKCKIEGKYFVIEFLLKLKDNVEIIEPLSLKKEMKELLEKMLKAYQ